MAKLIMLVGLPASGKSTLAKKLICEYSENNSVEYLSSDGIRLALYGDENIQDNPEKVFGVMFDKTVQALTENKVVIYDATNINRKLRIDLLRRLNQKVKNEFEKDCIIVYTDLDECKKRNASRSRVVPDSAIDRMVKCFDLPVYGEGWNNISVYYSTEPKYSIKDDLIEIFVGNLPHDNPHHKVSVDQHMKLSLYYFLNKFDSYFYPRYLRYAILFHDIGKKFCKSFIDRKGQVGTTAHYYQHANVGAYFALGIDFSIAEEDKYKLAVLINYHMRPLEAWKESKKAEEKDRLLLGDDLYDYLKILSLCDKMSEDDNFMWEVNYEANHRTI